MEPTDKEVVEERWNGFRQRLISTHLVNNGDVKSAADSWARSHSSQLPRTHQWQHPAVAISAADPRRNQRNRIVEERLHGLTGSGNGNLVKDIYGGK